MSNSLCRNCGQSTTKNFCPNCGQKNDVGQLTWSALTDSFVSTFVGDGAIGEKRSNIRYGFLLTLWAIITRPGVTVSEYLEGRRRKYFNPVTILLLLSGFYAILAPTIGYITPRSKITSIPIGRYIEFFADYCNSHPATWYLILMPFTALTYKWVFRKQSSLKYVEYIYMGVFVAIFSVSLLFLQMGIEMLPWTDSLNHSQKLILLGAMGAQGWFSINIYRTLFAIKVKRAAWSWIKVMIVSYVFCFFSIILVSSLVIGSYYLLNEEGFYETFSKTATTINGQAQ